MNDYCKNSVGCRQPDISTSLGEHERLLRESLYKVLTEAVLGATPGKLTGNGLIKVLDVGSGRGELLRLLAEQGMEVTGLDPAADCVAIASRYGTCLQGSFADIERLFKPGEFDVVVSSHVLEHVDSPLDALASLRRLGAAGYVFAVPNLHRSARLIRLLLGSTRADHPNHLFGWGRPEFEAALRKAGFTIVNWHADRVTINPVGGKTGAILTRVLAPLEATLLPRIFPLLASSLIVTCKPA